MTKTSKHASKSSSTSGKDAGPDNAEWIDRLVWSALWKVVAVGVVTALGVFVVFQTAHLLGLLAISTFFALAMIPGVNALNHKWHIPRGAAVGIIYLAAALFLVFMVGVLIPGIVAFAEAVSTNIGSWLDNLNEWPINTTDGPLLGEGAEAATANAMAHLGSWAGNVLGILSSGLGIIFDFFTIAAFTFYIAADYPRIARALMSRMPPERQRTFAWVASTSIEQTGGYFYSRLLLMIVCGSLGFVVMLVAGLPLVYALPLALFMGFVSEFIPFIGTYIGAAIPIMVLLLVEGFGSALILGVWVIIYQQIKNYVLNPRLSSKTMELNGAIAFGGAMAGGAIAGPMGAFMALPIAALITAIVKNSGRKYELVDDDLTDANPPTMTIEMPQTD